jgi:hypothetical protein
MRKIEVIVIVVVFSAVYMFEGETDKQNQVEAIRCFESPSPECELLGVVSPFDGVVISEIIVNGTEIARIEIDSSVNGGSSSKEVKESQTMQVKEGEKRILLSDILDYYSIFLAYFSIFLDRMQQCGETHRSNLHHSSPSDHRNCPYILAVHPQSGHEAQDVRLSKRSTSSSPHKPNASQSSLVQSIYFPSTKALHSIVNLISTSLVISATLSSTIPWKMKTSLEAGVAE